MSEAAGFGGDAGGDWPKASIGNYKGVMLCNRPNELIMLYFFLIL